MKLLTIPPIMLTSALLTLVAPAFAQSPASNSTSVAPATAASSTAAPGTTATASAPATASPNVIHVSKEYIKQLANYGFYPRNHGGQVVFCKNEAQLGSRFANEHCLDGPHLEIALKQFAAQRDYMTRTDALEQPNPKAPK
jgi:hypothetical protein